MAFRRQLVQQRLRLLQIERVEPFSEPAVDRSEQFASLLRLALVTPEAREAHCGAEFPGFGLLLARDRECTLEIRFSFRRIRFRRLQRDFPCNAIDLGLVPPFLGGFKPSLLRPGSTKRHRTAEFRVR